ncbi:MULTISPECIES: sedoheptulose 7-phosphate cyclase [unclassified Roseofilum]|uniref:sedoheptulose 7-phosphate cyclase n=1 Tax=unclassified Roseofilum TaxID=2620099 RepID=UPI000E8C2195|nr:MULTISPECIES: sedoheptulose 7-phosphate cyclase [unclassified Roseofilum]MBP0008929.1 sedoheptulose 7-phosphate cyclase [Roseofilum sp. Belize Diploria]MBP0032594.1 sedoheptulose 7-phosphate cyclase [Roseofilum sp. Belize BBD 4]HBQ97409.1 3-dehydroquinate synthase [Cyanobacteria bacterium UBA11691]
MVSPSLSNSDRTIRDRLNPSSSDHQDSDLLIWRPHDSKYQTSEWYTGYGEIEQEGDRRSFKVTATYTLQAEVKIVQGILDPTIPILANLYRERGRCISIIDRTIDELYGEALRHYFQVHEIPLELKVCRAWESDKTPETVHQLLHFLGKEGCDVSRNEPVLVVGGGVLSDVAGLACALQHRRTPYVMIGTSIVAAIDAGPSPRTCVNGELFKNSIGVYHPPVLTFVDRSFFRTLPTGHIRNGMAEIIKMAVTDDRELFELLEQYGVDLIETHFATVNGSPELEKIADEVIYRALYAYMKHEGTNMFETYQDRPHAYGHTWSPRFEPAAKLMHGHAVTIGMAFGATLSAKMDWIGAGDRDRIINLCRTLGLSVYHPIVEDTELMFAGQKNMRRKRGQGGLWAPLPQGSIGSCDYAQEVSPELLQSAITEHQDICSQFPDGGAGQEMYLSDLGLE